MVTTGLSGLAITYGAFNLTGIALAMLVGVLLNVLLRDKPKTVNILNKEGYEQATSSEHYMQKNMTIKEEQ